jgi:hypothetical protein
MASAKLTLEISHPPMTTSLGLTVGKISLRGKKTSLAPWIPILVVELYKRLPK